MPSELNETLSTFVAWAQENITGDEKGEAQIFLDRFFQALGHDGCLDVGGHPEYRIRKARESGRGVSFADYVWKPRVLIEMKKSGTDLSLHYRQAFDYWARLVPGRPRYTILCNFDEFWIYDFEAQMDTPVDKVYRVDLVERNGALAFLLPEPETPIFGNSHEKVTRQAAALLASCFNSLMDRGIDRDLSQRFTLQSLVALFAEDIGLLEPYVFARTLADCNPGRDSYDLVGGLFTVMNTPGREAGGRFRGVDYFNGGVFAAPARIELTDAELSCLYKATSFDWSRVRPEIFGTLFEHSLGQEARHAFGAHFTSAVDIMKIVGPTIVEPWSMQIESAKSQAELHALHYRMQNYTVLDPACGSGNFLYIAYRELKRLEGRIFERIAELAKRKSPGQRYLGFVTAANFYGIDVIPFAVGVAKVTMTIARKLAIDELHITENALPLDNLDENFMVGDALIGEDGQRREWPKCDAIIGNPPFLGSKRLKPARGDEYVNQLRELYPEVPGMSDYCVYWFRKAQDELPPYSQENPVSGRAGLVGTQNIRNNKSRVGGLDYIAAQGEIVEAVDNQPWSGEANVHVSLANWINGKRDPETAPNVRLWTKVEPMPEFVAAKRAEGVPKTKIYDLKLTLCTYINSALSDRTDVAGAAVLSANDGYCYTGQYPRHFGFMLDADVGRELLATDETLVDVIKPFLVGRELLQSGRPERFVIDFQKLQITDAQRYSRAFSILIEHVLPYVEEKARAEQEKDIAAPNTKVTMQERNWLKTWWQHFRPRAELIGKLDRLNRYIVCSRVTKRRSLFLFFSRQIYDQAMHCRVLRSTTTTVSGYYNRIFIGNGLSRSVRS